MKLGDLVMVKEQNLGIIVKVIDDAHYKVGVLHLKVYVFEYNNSAWYHTPSLTLISPAT